MSQKTVDFNNESIEKLPNDKPVVYKLLDKQGNNVYTGVAKRGRVKERLKEHVGEKRGVQKVKIEQMPTIKDAEAKERRIIKRTQPKKNKKGK